jgi:hypothetical protein
MAATKTSTAEREPGVPLLIDWEDSPDVGFGMVVGPVCDVTRFDLRRYRGSRVVCRGTGHGRLELRATFDPSQHVTGWKTLASTLVHPNKEASCEAFIRDPGENFEAVRWVLVSGDSDREFKFGMYLLP